MGMTRTSACDIPGLIGDDTKLHGAVVLRGTRVAVAGRGRRVADRGRGCAPAQCTGRGRVRRGRGRRRLGRLGAAAGVERVGQPPRASSMAMTAPFIPPRPISDMMRTRPRESAGSRSLAGLLGLDRVAHVVGHLAADVVDRRVQVAQRDVVGRVAVEPLVEDRDVDRVVASSSRSVRAAVIAASAPVERLDRASSYFARRGPARRRADGRSCSASRAERRLAASDPIVEPAHAASRPSVAPSGRGERACRATDRGRALEVGLGRADERRPRRGRARIAGGRGRDADQRARRPRRSRAPTVSRSLPFRAASAPRACVPSASTSAARPARSRLDGVEPRRDRRRRRAAVSVGPGRPRPVARSMAVTGPAAPSAMATTAASHSGPAAPMRRGATGHRRGMPVSSRRLAPGRGASAQVAQRARHVARLEPEARRDDVERPDVVEPELAQLVGGDREREVDELGRAGHEPDERHGHRDDDAPLAERAEDLRGDLAVRPVARPAELERCPDRRRVGEAPRRRPGPRRRRGWAGTGSRRRPGTGTMPGDRRTRPAMMLKNPSPGPNWSDGLRIVQSSPDARTSASAFAFELA